MKNHNKKFVLILFFISGIYSLSQSQSLYKVMINKDIDIKISGTSTLHDWEMDSYTTGGEAEFFISPDSAKVLFSVTSLSFSLMVKNLKSNNKVLDKNAYDALKSDDYQEIEYKLTSSTITSENGGYMIKSIGNLSIAGISKEINMDVHASVNKNYAVSCKGSYSINMSDFNVPPPSFMWGAMKTGDAIVLEFTVVYEKAKGAAIIN